MKPYLFLDIDGVIVPDYHFIPVDVPQRLQDTALEKVSVDDCVKFTAAINDGRFTDVNVYIPNEIVEGLHRLTDHFEIIWCSMWGEHTGLVADAIGLPKETVLRPDLESSGLARHDHSVMKSWATMDFLEKNGTRPSAFVDDHAVPRIWWETNERLDESDAHDWVPRERFPLSPEPAVGLITPEFDDLIEWAVNL